MEFLELGTELIFKTMADGIHAILSNMIYFGLAGLVLGIVLMFVGHRYQMFHRNNNLLKNIALFYYLYIPLLLAISGAIAGGLIAAEKFSDEHVKDKILLVTKWTFYPYQDYLTKNWTDITERNLTFEQTIDEYLSTLKFHSPSNGFWDKQQANIANKLVPESVKLGIHTLVTTPKGYTISDIEQEKEISSLQFLQTAKSMNVFEYDDSFWEAMDMSIRMKQSKMFNGFYLTLLVGFVLLMIIPVIEIILSSLYMKRKLVD